MSEQKEINIGLHERNKRLFLGISMILLGLGLWVWMNMLEVSQWLYVLLFIPFFIGSLGIFQSKEET
jgi:uncharacterized protein (DUF983 family)